MSNMFVVRNSATHSTAITILQITASSSKPLRLLRAWVTQSNNTTSAQAGIQIIRKTSAATVTSITPIKLEQSSSSAGATGGHTASSEGSDGDVLLSEGFNILNGWLYLPIPEERILVATSGVLALKFTAAPASSLYHYGMLFEEIG